MSTVPDHRDRRGRGIGAGRDTVGLIRGRRVAAERRLSVSSARRREQAATEQPRGVSSRASARREADHRARIAGALAERAAARRLVCTRNQRGAHERGLGRRGPDARRPPQRSTPSPAADEASVRGRCAAARGAVQPRSAPAAPSPMDAAAPARPRSDRDPPQREPALELGLDRQLVADLGLEHELALGVALLGAGSGRERVERAALVVVDPVDRRLCLRPRRRTRRTGRGRRSRRPRAR